MAVDPHLLALLACPICRTPVEVVSREAGEGLRCVDCGRVYPVEGDIPQMLPDRAEPEGPAADAS